jgi:phage terminase large subunit GpA-like protein
LLTGGVDVQGGGGSIGERLVLTVWGWGSGEEGWHIGHWEIDGDPQQREVWDQLDEVMAKVWTRQDGGMLKVSMVGIDYGGHAGTQVLEFCRNRVNRCVPMRGSGMEGKQLLGKGSPVDVNKKNQSVVKRGVLLYMIGYEASVNHLQARLRVEKPGPGYLHFGLASDDQFLGEVFPWKRVPKNRERTKYKWECPVGSRDEGGDCTRMAYAAMLLFSKRYNRATMWDQLAALVKMPKKEVIKDSEENPVQSRVTRRPGNFVTDW